MFDLTGMKAIIGSQLKILHLPGETTTIVYTRPDSFFGDQVFFLPIWCMVHAEKPFSKKGQWHMPGTGQREK